jgi:hypothetical protein
VGNYNTELRAQNAQGCEDWDLYLRIAEHYQFRVVPEFLVGYRKPLHSMSCDHTAMANSYCLVLKSIRQRYLEIPNFLFQLSIGNFFMYLAFECDRTGDYKNTLRWIWRALQSDPITPLIRPSFYQLVLKNGWKLLKQPSPSVVHTPSVDISQEQNHPSRYGIKSYLRVQLMVLIGNLFHYLVSLVGGLVRRHSDPRSKYELL